MTAIYFPFAPELWLGRCDTEESVPAPRWHQQVKDFNGLIDRKERLDNVPVMLGFSCDEGVKRNKGRAGASGGPDSLRKALSGLSWQPIRYLGADASEEIYDAGTVSCVGEHMESAQELYADKLQAIITAGGFPIGLGGGHEIAWASYQGLDLAAQKQGRNLDNLAVLNIDAHLDLRNPKERGSSGTPFRQIAEFRQSQNQHFHYCCLGVNPTANTRALFDYAAEQDVYWRADVDCTELDLPAVEATLRDFLADKDELYLTLCLDVISAAYAPGVSAPSALGVSPNFVLRLIHLIRQVCEDLKIKLVMVDVAEMNPEFDIDGRTAKLAARLIQSVIE